MYLDITYLRMRARRFATRGVRVSTWWAFNWAGRPFVTGRRFCILRTLRRRMTPWRRRIRFRRGSFLGRGRFWRWWRSFPFLFWTSSWYVIWCHWVTVVVRILVRKQGACYSHFVCSTSSLSKFWLRIWFFLYRNWLS